MSFCSCKQLPTYHYYNLFSLIIFRHAYPSCFLFIVSFIMIVNMYSIDQLDPSHILLLLLWGWALDSETGSTLKLMGSKCGSDRKYLYTGRFSVSFFGLHHLSAFGFSCPKSVRWKMTSYWHGSGSENGKRYTYPGSIPCFKLKRFPITLFSVER